MLTRAGLVCHIWRGLRAAFFAFRSRFLSIAFNNAILCSLYITKLAFEKLIQ